jgi:hypothetical protein
MKRYAKNRLNEAFGDLVAFFLKGLIPISSSEDIIDKAKSKKDKGKQGRTFADVVTGAICGILPGSGYFKSLYLEVPVADDGAPQSEGIRCGENLTYIRGFTRPDFIISPSTMSEVKAGKEKSWVIGDFKIGARNIKPKDRQFKAIMSHAADYEYPRVAVYITWKGASQRKISSLREQSAKDNGVLLLILSFR